MFGDDLVIADTPCVRQLIDVYEDSRPGAVIAVQNVPRAETCRYGIVKPKPNTKPLEMESIVEKPAPDQAPSTLAQFGRFVLPSRIIQILEKLELGKGNELWLTDALDKLCREQRVVVHEIDGTWYTMGDPLRYLIANVEYALKNRDVGKDFLAYLRTLNLSEYQ